MKRKFTLITAALALLTLIWNPIGLWGQDRASFTGTFTKITSTDDFETGYYVVVGKGVSSTDLTTRKAMSSTVNNNNRIVSTTVEPTNDIITNPDNTLVYYITVATSNNITTCTFKNMNTGTYMYQSSTTSGKGMGFSNNSYNITYVGYDSTNTYVGHKFTLNGDSNNIFKYNRDNQWFANYSGDYAANMEPVELYKCPAYTVTYNPVSESGTGTGTMTDSNSPYASGATVTVLSSTFTAPSGMDFNHWNTKADNTGISYDADNTFTISGNTTLYAIWGEPSSVAAPTFTVETGTYNVDQSVEIECETEGAAIYYTLDGSTPTSSSTLYESAINITETKTLKAIAIKDDESSNMAMATYTMKCATPTFNLPTGTYEGTQTIEIECVTSSVTIRYTNTGAIPTQYSYLYSEPFEITSTKTIKAVAKRTNWTDSEIAEATYTIINPYTTMQEIYDAATTTQKSVYIKLNNWVVTGAKENYAYVTDGTKGFEAFKYGGIGFSVGDKLTGTVQVGLKISNNHVQITGLDSSVENLTIVPDSPVTIADIAMADLEAVNTGALISYNDLTYSYSSSSHWLSDGTTTLKAYTTLMSLSNKFTSGKKYHVTGPFLQYGDTKQILPRTDADIKLAAQMTAPTFDAFSYLVADGGPATQYKSISGTDFSADLLVTAPANYQVSNDGETWASTATFTPNGSKAISGTLYVRLVSGLEVGTYNGDLTFTADGYLTPQTVALSGTVSASTTYSIVLNQTTGGTIAADVAVAEAGQTVTLSYSDLDDCYTFTGWTVLDGNADEVDVTNNQFTMPGSAVEVEGVFTKKTFTVEYSVNGVLKDALKQTGIACGDAATLKTASDLTDAGVTMPTGYSFAGWSTEESSSDIISSFTPTANSVLYAVMLPTGATAGYVRVTEDLGSDWAGDYLIAYSNTIFADGRVGGTGDNGIGKLNQKVDLSSSITNNTIPVSTGDTYKVTLEEITSGSNTYVLKTQDGQYNYYSSNNNGLSATTTKSTAATYPITITFTSSSDIKLALGGNAAGAVFRYNTDGYFRYYKNCGQNAVYLYKKQNPTAYTFVKDVSSAEPLSSIEETDLITVKSGGVLTLTGANNGTASNLIIEDGGQLIHTNAVQATLKKNINAATSWGGSKASDVDGWYTISPTVATYAKSNLGNTDTYDLYLYNESDHYWWNANGTAHPFSNLAGGRGYLYASENDVTISYAGEMWATNANVITELSYTPAAGDLAGVNLVGNRFTRNLVAGDVKLGSTALTTYYVAEGGDDIEARDLTSNPIKPGQGFIVQVGGSGINIEYNPTSKGETAYTPAFIRIEAGNERFMDRAYVQIGQGNTLRKMTLNNEVSHVYVMDNGKDYAAATIPATIGEMPVNFEVTKNGTYTLTVTTENLVMDYLHLIDNMTGNDIDLLATPTYTFSGKTTDYATRFHLVFSVNDVEENEDVNSANFAYFDGSNWVVSNTGKASLQVVDVTGRLISSEVIEGNASLKVTAAPGLYVMRLVSGNNVRVQKIVVR